MGKLYEEASPDKQVNSDIETPSNENAAATETQQGNYKRQTFPKVRKYARPLSRLRSLRKAQGLTLEHLAQLADISPSYLSRLEAGDRRLNSDLIERLSTVLHCSPGDLLMSDEAASATSGLSQGSLSAAGLHMDLPVYKLCLGEEHDNIPKSQPTDSPDKAFLSKDHAVSWIYRPIQLFHVPEAFAVDVVIPDFFSRYKEGDQLLIHPSKPLSNGCSVLAIYKDDSVKVGSFDGWHGESLHLKSYAMSAGNFNVLSLHKDQLKAVYRIIGTIERN